MDVTANAEQKTSHFSWNVVTRGLHGHPLLRQRIHSKLRILERHLQHFPPDAVHLLIALERHPRKEEHRAALTLRLPSHVLHADKTARSVIAALSNTMKALLQELKLHKAHLRAEPLWKRKASRKTLKFSRAPEEGGDLPESLSEVRELFFESHRPRLVRFARRAASRARSSHVPIAEREAAELVGEAKDKLAALTVRRQPGSDRAQLYRLVREAIGRRGTSEVQSAQSSDRSGARDASAQSSKASSGLPLLPAMDRVLVSLPSFERDVFDLHYVEGFEPDEIAMITGKSLTNVNNALRAIKDRIRQQLQSEPVGD
jgi:DNA-directed RNA polymerase specialized sigma24 family protein/ribosome-associated translation inhibitor RaiA